MKLISVIIVEYNDFRSVNRALVTIDSYLSQLSYEVIVVSNSGYGELEHVELRRLNPSARILFNRENLGFAKACNQGIKASDGEFILILNPDAELKDNNITNAICMMKENNKVAVIGPKIIDRTGQVQDSNRNFLNLSRLIRRTTLRLIKGIGNIPEKKDLFSPHAVNWISGACMLVRKSAIKKAGMMDERYFMYVEDMDWCRTFWRHGYEVWYCPKWVVEHNAGRGSTKKLTIENKLMWIHALSLIKYFIKWAHTRNQGNAS